MAKYKTFFNNLITVLNRYDNDDIKTAIGDSTNNNRTVTVNQVIRFLGTRRNAGLKSLGEDLSFAYDTLREDIAEARTTNNRSDAFDINEFINVYDETVIYGADTDLRRTFGKQFTA